MVHYDSIRVLAIERIRELVLSDEEFAFPEGFHPVGKLEEAFDLTLVDPIAVRVHIAADQARYIEDRAWASHQSVSRGDDGSITLELESCGVADVKRWVLSLGVAHGSRSPPGWCGRWPESTSQRPSRMTTGY